MAGETNSTNMGMPIPGVNVTQGPTWASDLNASLTIVDAHDHTVGSGVQITPNGININSNLTFGSNSATNLKSIVFTSQAAAITGTNFISFVGGNLYVNDSSGNQIPITASGGVAGSPGSIGSLAAPASATYSAANKQFSWKSDSTKAAAMDNGAVTIRETNIAAAKGVTLASPSGLGTDYQLTLLSALPGSVQALNCDASGNLGTITYDSIGSTMTSTGANAIAATRTRATGTTVAAGGVGISSSSTGFTTTSVTYVDVLNLSVTITTSGRPTQIMFVPDGSATPSKIAVSSTGGVFPDCTFKLLRDAVTVGIVAFGHVTVTNSSLFIPASSLGAVDAVAAGTYVYKLQVLSGNVNTTVGVTNTKMIVYEL